MKMECQPIMLLPHTIHHQGQPEPQFQHQLQAHQLSPDYNHNQHHQQGCNNHHARHQQQLIAECQFQQQQQPQGLPMKSGSPVFSQMATGPPTPPGDEGVYQAPCRGTWLMQTQPNQHQQASNRNHSQTNTAYIQTSQNNGPANHHNNHLHHQHHLHLQQQQQHGPTNTIASYYYDIDDEFSDILSAPPTPEPVACLGSQTSLHPNSEPQNDYQTYLPFVSNQPTALSHQFSQHNQQQQQQQLVQLTYDSCSHYVMSPDSSSLSTSASSPSSSDHSLYQPSTRPAMQVNRRQVKQERSPLASSESQQQLHLSQRDSLSGGNVNRQQQQQQQQQQGLLLQPQAAQNQPPPAHRSSPIHLWEFLKELLQQVDSGCADATAIRWLDKQKGVFKIEDSVRVAKLWGKRKNKPKMNYDKLSRSIRQYYKKGIMKKTDRSQRLVYQFCSAYCH